MAKGVILTVVKLMVFKALSTVYCFCGTPATGTIILSPGAVAPVCRVGDQLELTCTVTNGTFIRWSFTVRNEQGRLQEYPRFISQDGTQQIQVSEIRVNTTVFTFMRTSAQGSSPLISTLIINSVSSTLNGTVVHCEEVGTSMTASTTISLFDIMNIASLQTAIINNIDKEYRENNILINVTWPQENGVQYNISITPSVPMTFIGRTIVQLLLSYNMEYNVSVTTACQGIAPSYIPLFYAQCRDLQLTVANNSKLRVMYNDLLLIEGTTVGFTCPPGLVLNGAMSATCMTNGEWEPDLQDVNCIEAKCGHPVIDSQIKVVGFDGDSLTADNGTTINFTCPPNLSLKGINSTACTGNEEWTPDPSGVMCIKVAGNFSSASSMSLIIIGVSASLGVSVLITLSACAIVVKLKFIRRGSFKRSSTSDVFFSPPQRCEQVELRSSHDVLQSTQNESEYSVLRYSHGRSEPEKTTDAGKEAASKTPDIVRTTK